MAARPPMFETVSLGFYVAQAGGKRKRRDEEEGGSHDQDRNNLGQCVEDHGAGEIEGWRLREHANLWGFSRCDVHGMMIIVCLEGSISTSE